MRRTQVVALAALLWMHSQTSEAQEPTDDEAKAGELRTEDVDSTRLDVSRLPPEAIEVT